MKVIIAGTRTLEPSHKTMVILEEAIIAAATTKGIVITEVVSGGARGADRLGEMWAREHGKPVKVFNANWDAFGRSAGPVRNQEMADYADALIALWDGVSKGTHHMICAARANGILVHVEQFTIHYIGRELAYKFTNR